MKQPSTLVIVPCGRSKIWDKNPDAGPTVAKDAYAGSPFKVNRRYAERVGSDQERQEVVTVLPPRCRHAGGDRIRRRHGGTDG